MNLAAYIRCSTDQQEDSPAVQRAVILAWATREGHSIVAEYVDEAVSGGIPIAQRPAARQMLEDAKSKRFQGIVVKQLDRLGRNAADSISFPGRAKKMGLELFFVQESFADTPAGRVHFGMLSIINQYYREDIGQKIRDANLTKARGGRWMGGTAPYGYVYDRANKRLIPDPARARDVVTVFETYIRCNGSREATCKELNRLGIPGPQGTRWLGIRLTRILSNPIYTGQHRYAQAAHTTADWQPVVPAELVTRALHLFEVTRGRKTRGASRVHPYSGMLYCGVCGQRVWSAHPPDPARGIRTQYKCMSRMKEHLCTAKALSESRLDAMIVPKLAEIIRLHRAALESKLTQRAEAAQPDPRERLRFLEGRRERLLETYLDGLVDKAIFEVKLAAVDRQIAEARGVVDVSPALDSGLAAAMLDDITGFWQSLTDQEKQALLLAIAPRIIVWGGRPARCEIHSPLLDEPVTSSVLSHRPTLRP